MPSLTEAVAVSAPGALVAVTDWCTHPADLVVQRIGGTKNPRVDAVIALAPDLGPANEAENREVDHAAMRVAGLTVAVTHRPTVDQGLAGCCLVHGGVCGAPLWLVSGRGVWG